MQPKGNKYGTHRVIEPKGVLPQPANKLDNNMDVLYDNEIPTTTPSSRPAKVQARRKSWKR